MLKYFLSFYTCLDTLSLFFLQRADQQASVADRPSVRVPKGPGGGKEEPSGAAVLALPAQQGGGRAGAVDCSEGGGRQLARTGSRL